MKKRSLMRIIKLMLAFTLMVMTVPADVYAVETTNDATIQNENALNNNEEGTKPEVTPTEAPVVAPTTTPEVLPVVTPTLAPVENPVLKMAQPKAAEMMIKTNLPNNAIPFIYCYVPGATITLANGNRVVPKGTTAMYIYILNTKLTVNTDASTVKVNGESVSVKWDDTVSSYTRGYIKVKYQEGSTIDINIDYQLNRNFGIKIKKIIDEKDKDVCADLEKQLNADPAKYLLSNEDGSIAYIGTLSTALNSNTNFTHWQKKSGDINYIDPSDDTTIRNLPNGEYSVIETYAGGGMVNSDKSSIIGFLNPGIKKDEAVIQYYTFKVSDEGVQEWMNECFENSQANISFFGFYSNKIAVLRKVNFDANSGTGTMKSQTSTDAAVNLSKNTFVKKGYKFTGWNTVANPTSSNPGVSYNDRAKFPLVVDETTLYAQWQKDENQTKTISYYVDHWVEGESIRRDRVIVSQTVWTGAPDILTVKPVVLKEYKGYSFAGYDPTVIPETINAKDVIKVLYEPTKYVIHTISVIDELLNNQEIALEHYTKVLSTDDLAYTKGTIGDIAQGYINDAKYGTKALYQGYKNEVLRKGATDWVAYEEGMIFKDGDQVKTVIQINKDLTQTKEVTYTVEHWLENGIVAMASDEVKETVWLGETGNMNVQPITIRVVAGYHFAYTNPETLPTTIAPGSVIKVIYATNPVNPVNPVGPEEPDVPRIIEPIVEPIVQPVVVPVVNEPVQPNVPIVEEITPDDTPLAQGMGGSWALINLVCSLGTMLLGMWLLLSKFYKEEEKENDDALPQNTDEEAVNAYQRRRWTKFAAVVVTIVSILIFILTENMRLPMILVDKWTWVMAVLFIAQVLVLVIGKQWKTDKSEENDSTNA